MNAADALLERLKAAPRDERLWAAFYGELYPQVFVLTAHLCSDTSLAEDLTQDAFVRFVRSGGIKKVISNDAAVAYLRAIVRNLIRDHFRKRAQHPTISTEAIGQHELERALEHTIRRTITAVDVLLIRDLREEDRTLLRQIIEGRSIAEVAHHMGLTYSAAAVRIHRLRKQLRRYL